MNANDLSDEAFWQWDQNNDRLHWDKSFSEHALDGWQECRRRAINREVIAFQEGWEAACKAYPKLESK